MEFTQSPETILETKEDVRAFLASYNRNGRENLDSKWRIKSLWIIGLINEIVDSGKYPYNATVKQMAEERLGFEKRSDAYYATEGDNLSLLVYNAQRYRDHDTLVANGFEQFTPEMLQQAHQQKKQVELSSGTRLNPRMIEGKLYAMMPRKRNRHISPIGQPARLVKKNAPAVSLRKPGEGLQIVCA